MQEVDAPGGDVRVSSRPRLSIPHGRPGEIHRSVSLECAFE